MDINKENEIAKAVLRINQMESLFDKITEICEKNPKLLNTPTTEQKIQILSDYYSNGDWMHDYEMDESRILPSDLKRGVLSEDGLYNLLREIRQTEQKDE